MILVVDDNADLRKILTAMLRFSGYEVAAVDSGEAALAHLAVHLPHCVILDINMPVMDGIDVLKAIRASDRLKSLRVIVYSAYDGLQKDRAIAAGADAFVLKCSLDWAQLIETIEKYCVPSNPARGSKAPDDRDRFVG